MTQRRTTAALHSNEAAHDRRMLRLTKRQSLSGVTSGLQGANNAANDAVQKSAAGLTQTQLIGVICAIVGFLFLCGWLLWRCSARRVAKRNARKEAEDRERIQAQMAQSQYPLQPQQPYTGAASIGGAAAGYMQSSVEKRKSDRTSAYIASLAPYSSAEKNSSQKDLLAEERGTTAAQYPNHYYPHQGSSGSDGSEEAFSPISPTTAASAPAGAYTTRSLAQQQQQQQQQNTAAPTINYHLPQTANHQPQVAQQHASSPVFPGGRAPQMHMPTAYI